MEKSIPAQIVAAIKGEDREIILDLFSRNPEQVTFITPFAAQTWLGYAAQIGKLNSIKCLIEAGLDVNIGDARDDEKPICSAAENRHYHVVEYLLGCGTVLDVSTSIRNPLFSAILGGSADIVKLLLEAGIDSTVRYNSKTMTDIDAVAFALMRGEKECAKTIALWNADDNEDVAEKALVDGFRIAKIKR